jgi:hypothetical protein
MQPYYRGPLLFMLKHLVAGACGGVLLGALVLWYDIAGIATMAAASSDEFLIYAMLFFGLFITFGSIGMAVGVMGLGEERDSDPIRRPPGPPPRER